MNGAPAAAIHLLATGSVLESDKGDHWGRFEDLAWLKFLAHRHRIAALSGDIHGIAFHTIAPPPAPLATTLPLPALYDFSASGAAIRKGISVGRDCQNHALLDIGANRLECHWYMFGQDTTPRAGANQARRLISRFSRLGPVVHLGQRRCACSGCLASSQDR